MRELFDYLVRRLVSEPDSVEVRELLQDNDVRIEIRVAAQDVGKVVGRQGRVIQSLRTLARAAAAREGRGRVTVEVVE